ncbi:hypothetical protein OHA45_20685 [Streptomyces lydicus]|uniref:hypothetical protein n=1 Tax=Streptomyces lydicus TaxID=47763 RepID=UPI002E37D9E0|nr:hypothetical protein [Streptomyces lydicus]
MDTERLRLATQSTAGAAPIDGETISETIRGARRTGSGPIDPALLLIEARQRAPQLGRGTIEARHAVEARS